MDMGRPTVIAFALVAALTGCAKFPSGASSLADPTTCPNWASSCLLPKKAAVKEIPDHPSGRYIRLDELAGDVTRGWWYISPKRMDVTFRDYVLSNADYEQTLKVFASMSCSSRAMVPDLYDHSQMIEVAEGGKIRSICVVPPQQACWPFSATNLVMLMSVDPQARASFDYRNLIQLGGDLVCQREVDRQTAP